MKTKNERGVMVMKNGRAWGMTYSDGQCTCFGWMEPVIAPIHNPKFCTKPTDVLSGNSPYATELIGAELVKVERTTTIKVVE